jgi:hypothetical protein
MATFHDFYVGWAQESTYGTFVAAANFVDGVLSEGIQGKYERIESEGLRSGNKVLRSDRWAVNQKGAEGDLKVECMDVGLEVLFKNALGTLSSAAPSGGFTVHTITLGDLAGQSLSVKVGRVDSSGTINPFNYAGGKIKGLELSNAVDGILQASFDMDFASEATGTTATPTYPAFSAQLLTFANGSCTVGGTAFAVTDVSVKIDNGLKTDRYALRGTSSTTKREPLVEGLRNITWDIKGEFENLTQYNRVASATTAGALATLTLLWNTPQGGQLQIDMPVSRFDDGIPNVDGAKVLELALTGKALNDGTQQPITITYKAKSS